MEVSFSNQDIEDLCCKPKLAIKHLGKLSAKVLSNRLDQLFAAANVAALTAGRPHPLKGDRLGELALDLYAGDRMVLISAVELVPLLADGSVNWRLVTHVQVIEIGDYHD